jgi:hypothetical protein
MRRCGRARVRGEALLQNGRRPKDWLGLRTIPDERCVIVLPTNGTIRSTRSLKRGAHANSLPKRLRTKTTTSLLSMQEKRWGW